MNIKYLFFKFTALGIPLQLLLYEFAFYKMKKGVYHEFNFK